MPYHTHNSPDTEQLISPPRLALLAKGAPGEQLWVRRRVLSEELRLGHGGEILTESVLRGAVGDCVVGRHLIDDLSGASLNYLMLIDRLRRLSIAKKSLQ